VTVAPWLTIADLPAERPQVDDEALWTRAIDTASHALAALAGGRWHGRRRRVVDLWAPPSLVCVDPCSGPRRVRLPDRDPVELLAVADAAGGEQPLDRYRLAPGGWVEALPGLSVRMPTPTTPLRLTYSFGSAPPPDAVASALTLAVELGRAEVDPDASALPDNVTQIVRQGVTYAQLPAQALIAQGSTGLYPVDLWLATVNPGRARRPPRSWNPDTEAPYRIVSTTPLEATP